MIKSRPKCSLLYDKKDWYYLLEVGRVVLDMVINLIAEMIREPRTVLNWTILEITLEASIIHQ